VPTELFELKVIVEADDWRDVATMMSSVDDALEPHRDDRVSGRRWSVVARLLPDGQAEALRWFLEQSPDDDRPVSPAGRLSA
jgi:hypothetical protein